jgi:cold shock CspA family protein
MHQGELLRWFEDRGFGFIKPDQTSLCNGDVFLHRRHIKSGDPRSGARVTFELYVGDGKRPAANNAVII